MSVPPKTYRVYTFDVERKDVGVEFLTAVDDSDAVAKAGAATEGSKCEIWDGKRLVAQLDPQAQAPVG